ncbi:hypothetical protein FF38_10881 [Lucilia cuprina]|uniref:Uncharacterized protein n=1 Tax=Lucilia cuprina TaxID=7375 RepID=A0A0L0CNS8_LUCCU|nr:hypothetical protein FF38_10881 [Lucilia cuprina]
MKDNILGFKYDECLTMRQNEFHCPLHMRNIYQDLLRWYSWMYAQLVVVDIANFYKASLHVTSNTNVPCWSYPSSYLLFNSSQGLHLINSINTIAQENTDFSLCWVNMEFLYTSDMNAFLRILRNMGIADSSKISLDMPTTEASNDSKRCLKVLNEYSSDLLK